MSHTPRPWTVSKALVVQAKNTWIASVWFAKDKPRIDVTIERAEAVANAHLITAAPDLLEAAKAKLADCDDCKDAALMPGEYCSDECVALAVAIAKAEGK